MAIKANYVTSANTINGATFRVMRVWMSKQEGFNAWIGVFANSSDDVPQEQFSVSTEYVEGQNPFDALYTAVAKLSFVEDVVHDVVTPLNSIVEVVPVVEKVVEEVPDVVESKPKKRTKKA